VDERVGSAQLVDLQLNGLLDSRPKYSSIRVRYSPRSAFDIGGQGPSS
jgi:hypothetical protein